MDSGNKTAYELITIEITGEIGRYKGMHYSILSIFVYV